MPANERRERVERREIKLTSPIIAKISPRKSPKLKKSDKFSKNDKNNKIEARNQSPNIAKKSKKVKELIKCFEGGSIEDIESKISKTVVSKEIEKDAFKVLMSGKTGDTLTRTPVRKRLKD